MHGSQYVYNFFKSIPEVVFYEGIQHRLQFYFDHLNCVKLAVSSMGEIEKSCTGPS
jgi:hypothetical protein